MTLAQVMNRADVQSVLAQVERMFEEAGELPLHDFDADASLIEIHACDPFFWLGGLEYKMLERLGLSDEELDLLVNR